jgi:hypothetical protein
MPRGRVFNDPDVDRSVVKATGVTLAKNSATGDGSLPSEATEGTAAPITPLLSRSRQKLLVHQRLFVKKPLLFVELKQFLQTAPPSELNATDDAMLVECNKRTWCYNETGFTNRCSIRPYCY